MNILQLHDLVKFWIDEYGSPRQSDYDLDQAIWSAAKAIVDEKYDHSKRNHPTDSVERTQKVRDELYTLVYQTPLGSSAVPVSSNVIAASEIPDSYKYLLLLEVVALASGDPDINTEWKICEAVPYDWKRDYLTRNPYRKPKNDGLFDRNYYEENVTGFIIHTEVSGLNFARITYLKEPDENFIGIEEDAGYSPAGNISVIALGDITFQGTGYTRGDVISIPAGFSWTGDSALRSFVNPDLPLTLHDEIAKKAAYFILERSNLFEKAAMFEKDILTK